jgi:hypothetical protein
VGFELCNFQTQKQINEIDARASRGGINKDGYIKVRLLIERKTMIAAREYYHSVWMPNCRHLKLFYEDRPFIDLYGEGVKVLSEREVLELFFKPKTHHYQYYARIYDQLQKSGQ